MRLIRHLLDESKKSTLSTETSRYDTGGLPTFPPLTAVRQLDPVDDGGSRRHSENDWLVEVQFGHELNQSQC